MINNFDNCEADVEYFDKAVKKYNACSESVQFTGQKSCKIFSFKLDNSFDIINHCVSCPHNTKSPTTRNIKVRFP